MAQRKKKRTSIRTAAGTAQTKFLERLRALRDDPLVAFPEIVGDTPKPLMKVKQGLHKLAEGKAGFLIKKDRGVLGAVYHSLPLAELEAVPRLLDHKVGGRRRFYLIRGQVARGCMLGVQNHDDPQVLMMAYREMAKDCKLHFFVTDKLICTGAAPSPPTEWWAALAERSGIAWTGGDDKDCGHEGDKAGLRFHGGAALTACRVCLEKAGNLHVLMKSHYSGPRERQPFEVFVTSGNEMDREKVAQVRAGVMSEAALL